MPLNSYIFQIPIDLLLLRSEKYFLGQEWLTCSYFQNKYKALVFLFHLEVLFFEQRLKVENINLKVRLSGKINILKQQIKI